MRSAVTLASRHRSIAERDIIWVVKCKDRDRLLAEYDEAALDASSATASLSAVAGKLALAE
jgi:hypothetical protein